MFELIQNLTIPILSMIIGTILALKIAKNTIKNMIFDVIYELKDDLKADTEQWLNSETGQKAIYQIGGIIGAGAKTGLGLGRGGSKKGLEGLVIDLIGSWLHGKNPLQEQPSGNVTLQPNPTQNLNRA